MKLTKSRGENNHRLLKLGIKGAIIGNRIARENKYPIKGKDCTDGN